MSLLKRKENVQQVVVDGTRRKRRKTLLKGISESRREREKLLPDKSTVEGKCPLTTQQRKKKKRKCQETKKWVFQKGKKKTTNNDGNLEINWFPYEKKTHPTLFLFFSISTVLHNEYKYDFHFSTWNYLNHLWELVRCRDTCQKS